MALARPLRAPRLLCRLWRALRGRRGACALAMAGPSRFSAELPDGTLAHFAVLSDGARGANDPGARADPRLAELLGPPGRCYSVCVGAAARGGCAGRVRAARLHQSLLQELRRGPFQGCGLSPLLCYDPGRAGGTQRGFLLRDPGEGPNTRRALLELLGTCGEAARPHVGEFEADREGGLWQRLWALQEGGQLQLGRARVVSAPEPPVHPMVADLASLVVFPDRDAARAVLEECTSFIPEARAVLDLVDQCPKQVQKGKFQVTVIEGLDATGKTTVTQSVLEALKGTLLQSPPPCISQWRKIFDAEPTIIRRAFYSLGNYLVASEIAKESTMGPVVVDRYWHSTAAYAIASEVSGGPRHLPPVHHPIYQWPRDLLKPDLVLLLTVSPEERARRLQARGLEKTREEAELEANSVFRQKVEMTYQRMENPGCQVVDASPSREVVLQTVLHLIQNTAS